jgi:hypothetical protein
LGSAVAEPYYNKATAKTALIDFIDVFASSPEPSRRFQQATPSSQADFRRVLPATASASVTKSAG